MPVVPPVMMIVQPSLPLQAAAPVGVSAVSAAEITLTSWQRAAFSGLSVTIAAKPKSFCVPATVLASRCAGSATAVQPSVTIAKNAFTQS